MIYRIAVLAAFLGLGLGDIAVERAAAQLPTPVYYVAEIDVTDLEGYERDYVPKVKESMKEFGGKALVAGQKVTAIEGAPPTKRVAIVLFPSMDQLMAWRNSDAYKENRKISDQYGTVRAYAVEAISE